MASFFHWADYLLCAFSLLISISVGIYYGFNKSKDLGNKAEEFLLGSRNLKTFPVSLSMFVSWLSAIAFIGDPVEVYYHGSVYLFLALGYCLPIPLVAHLFAPVYNRMKLISIYEFLERRFSFWLRVFASILNSGCLMLYLGIVLYAPAVALSQVTRLTEWISIMLIGVIGASYTVMGGMRAVVWADTLQSGIMLAGLLAILIQGLITVGGFGNVWRVAQSTGRANFLKNEWSPFVRSTPMAYVVGGFLRVFVPYISGQMMVQRYFSLPTEKHVVIAVYINLPLYLGLVSLFTMIGLTMYTYYDGCDPIADGRINRPDQLVPLFMMDMLGYLPGVPGIFLASLFAASLSSVSSVLNSVATTVVSDLWGPFYTSQFGKAPTDQLKTKVAKIATLACAVVVIILALLTLLIETNVFPLTVMTTGILITPLSVMFILGMYTNFIKTWHVFSGTIASFIVCFTIGIGALVNKPPPQSLPTSTDECESISNYSLALAGASSYNMSMIQSSDENAFLNETQHEGSQIVGGSNLYSLTPLLYSFVSLCIVTVVTLALGLGEALWNKYYHNNNAGQSKTDVVYTGTQQDENDQSVL